MKAKILIAIFGIGLFACSFEEDVLLKLVNDVRLSGYRCGEDWFPPTTYVSWNTRLEQAAHDHSLDMYTNKFISHVGSDGSSPNQRASRRGYNVNGMGPLGENVAWGYETEEEVIAAWLSSPGHCRNIMNPRYRDMGIAREGNYWTQLFGAERQ